MCWEIRFTKCVVLSCLSGAVCKLCQCITGTGTQSLFVLFKAPPRIQLAPGPTYTKKGSNVTLTKCHVTGFPAPVVTWRTFPVSHARDRTVQDGGLLTVSLAAKQDIGSYVCHAKNDLGEASAVTSLVVISVPKFITKPPQTIIKLLGDDLSLNCSASGQPVPTVSWKRSTGTWNDERMKVQRGSLQISRLNETDSGIYICEAKVPFYTIETRSHLLVAGKYLGLLQVRIRLIKQKRCENSR